MKNKMESYVSKICNNVLDIVVDNFDYFRENPKHLAWAMMNYRLISIIGNNSFGESIGYFDVVDERRERLSSEEDIALLYDAFDVSASNEHEFPDTHPDILLESKPNKTLDEWVELMTDKRSLRGYPLYSSEFEIKNYLLCYSSDHKWNSEGFLAPTGGFGTDKTIFCGYTRVEDEMNPEIREKIIQLRSDPKIKSFAEDYLRKANENAQRIYAGESWLEVFDPEEAKELERNKEDLEDEEIRNKIIMRVVDIYRGKRPGLDCLVGEETAKEILDDEEIQERLAENGEEFLTEQGIIDALFDLYREEEVYYPLSSDSNLVRMPDNVHHSYVKAGIEMARTILEKPEEPGSSKEDARAFLGKWDK